MTRTAVSPAMDTPPADRQPRPDVEPSLTWRPAQGVEIAEVSSRRALRDFLRTPYDIYRDDPHWVAPLEREVKAFLDSRKHPFYRHGAATQFVARRNGRPVGRVLVSDDPRYNAQHETNLGCFGLFESSDDPLVTAGLLDAASGWLRARGRNEMLGPIDYSLNYPAGLLIEGFDTPPRLMMNHHRPYYRELLEGWGLEKAKDLYAWWFDEGHKITGEWRSQIERLKERFDVTVRPLDTKDFDAEIARCKEVYNGAWEDCWGFVKMTDAEFDSLGRQLRHFAVPEMILLAEIGDRPVGLCITLPDLNEAIRPANGRLFRGGLPVGLAKFLWRMKRVKTCRLAVLGVVKGYRRRGIAEMLIQRTFDYGKDTLGYTGAELSWTLEDNDLINRSIQRVGGHRYKTYRIFRREI